MKLKTIWSAGRWGGRPATVAYLRYRKKKFDHIFSCLVISLTTLKPIQTINELNTKKFKLSGTKISIIHL